MEYKQIRIVIGLLLVVSIFCCQCSSESKTKKDYDFYDYARTFDLYRIPIIEPYQLILADNYAWELKLQNKELDRMKSISNIDSIGVDGNVFVLYSPLIYIPGGMTKAWFVIDASTKKAEYFTSVGKYLWRISEKNIPKIKLHSTKQVYDDFSNKAKLPSEWPMQPNR